jgi:CBS domain-containing protein
MSFLISFNGQFSPYLHPLEADPRNSKIRAIQGLDPFTSREIDYQPANDGNISHHTPSTHVKAYEQQVKTFEKAKKRTYAKNIMSSPIHFVHTTTSMSEALGLMKKFGFKHLPVLDQKESLAGLLSDREFIGANPQSLCDELMLTKVLVALQTASIAEIAHIMLEEKINALPIVNDHHLVLGIITHSDILKFVIGNEDFTGTA